MDKVYVHIAQNYYCHPQKPFYSPSWAEKDEIERICSSANKLKPLLCDVKAPNFKLLDYNGQLLELYSINEKYTVLIFFNYDTPHKDFWLAYADVKEYESVLLTYNAKFNIKFIGIWSGDLSKRKEKESLNYLNSFTNVLDIDNAIKNQYNISTTPAIYLLDRNKKILAKYIKMNDLKELIDWKSKN